MDCRRYSIGRWLVLLSLTLVFSACSQAANLPVVGPALKNGPFGTPTPSKPTTDQVAASFFEAWEQGQYDQMYRLLSSRAQASISQSTFVERYTNIHDGLAVSELTVQAQPATKDLTPRADESSDGTATPALPRAAVRFSVTRKLAIFGELSEDNELSLVEEQGDWKVDWQPGLIFKELTNESKVQLTTDPAPRGRILDRNGKPLAEDGKILSIGVVPGEIQDEAALLKALSGALKLDPETIKQLYQGGQPDWFMPVAERPAADRDALEQSIGAIPGVAIQSKTARVYPLGPAAGHVVGYVSQISADELKELAPEGYEESDLIGRTGIEGWGEETLAGKKGGTLLIVDENGQPIRTIADKAPVPGSDIQLTIDADIQAKASEVLGNRPSSVVVMDPRDNSILAIASQPTFDPNHLVIGLSQAEFDQLNQSKAFIFRAVQQGYPTGSIFKVITMTAGLEKGGYKPTDTFDCGLEWRGLPGVVLRNWKAQARLDLIESLSQSCNPTFYSIGLKLDETDSFILPNIARAFGLGQPTGVEGLEEIAGVVPDPTWKQQQIGQPWYAGDAVNLAIGQGYLLATPLQMANAYSAIANGGTLRTPVLIKAIKRPDGSEEAFTAKDKGQLPMSPETRSYILEGMQRAASTPDGTAYYAFRDAKTPTAAKTGSAENPGPDAHAWFAGFETPTEPKVVIVTMVEGGQAGGTVAAPLARQIFDFAYSRIP